MEEIDVDGKIQHSIYNLLFTTTVTGNMIKVFGCSEEFALMEVSRYPADGNCSQKIKYPEVNIEATVAIAWA